MFNRVLLIVVTVCALAAIPCEGIYTDSSRLPDVSAAALERTVRELLWYRPEVYEGMGDSCEVKIINWREDGKKYDDLYGYLIKAPDEIYDFRLWDNEFGRYIEVDSDEFYPVSMEDMNYLIDIRGLYGAYTVRVDGPIKPVLPYYLNKMIKEDLNIIEQCLTEYLQDPQYSLTTNADYRRLSSMNVDALSPEDRAYIAAVLSEPEPRPSAIVGDVTYYIGYLYKQFNSIYYKIDVAFESDVSKSVITLRIFTPDPDSCRNRNIRAAYYDDFNFYMPVNYFACEEDFVTFYHDELEYFETLKRTNFFSGVIHIDAPNSR